MILTGKNDEIQTNEPEKVNNKETVTDTVQKAMDIAGFDYNYNKAKNVFMTVLKGDDLPISMNVVVDDSSIYFVSHLYLKAQEDRFRDVCWELNLINKQLVFGSFFLDPDDGMISLVYGFPYVEAKVSPEFILTFMKMLLETVDRFDGNLKKLAESVKETPGNDAMYG